MNKRCDEELEQQLAELMPLAAPRLEPSRSKAMRRRLVSAVGGGNWLRIAQRTVVGFAVAATALGSVTMAAAVSHPGQPAYALKQAFDSVHEAVKPEKAVVPRRVVRPVPLEQPKAAPAATVPAPAPESEVSTPAPRAKAVARAAAKTTAHGKAVSKAAGRKQSPKASRGGNNRKKSRKP